MTFRGRTGEMVVVTATGLEARAAHHGLPGVEVLNGGIGLAKLRDVRCEIAIGCGVAGGLRTGMRTGTVVVATEIVRDGEVPVQTDAELTAAFAAGARRLGFQPVLAPLLGSTTLVTGTARVQWATSGCAAADMESRVMASGVVSSGALVSGIIAMQRLAVVRVVLDTPERELSENWLHPVSAILQPRLWGELWWLARNAPPCAARAAAVVRAGLELL